MNNKDILQLIRGLAEAGDTMNAAESAVRGQECGPRVGDKLIIRTVTHYYTGEVLAVCDKWLKLGTAAWIADTGRWAQALANGSLNEIEPYPNGCFVAIGAIVDVAPWDFDLPKVAK